MAAVSYDAPFFKKLPLILILSSSHLAIIIIFFSFPPLLFCEHGAESANFPSAMLEHNAALLCDHPGPRSRMLL